MGKKTPAAATSQPPPPPPLMDEPLAIESKDADSPQKVRIPGRKGRTDHKHRAYGAKQSTTARFSHVKQWPKAEIRAHLARIHARTIPPTQAATEAVGVEEQTSVPPPKARSLTLGTGPNTAMAAAMNDVKDLLRTVTANQGKTDQQLTAHQVKMEQQFATIRKELVAQQAASKRAQDCQDELQAKQLSLGVRVAGVEKLANKAAPQSTVDKLHHIVSLQQQAQSAGAPATQHSAPTIGVTRLPAKPHPPAAAAPVTELTTLHAAWADEDPTAPVVLDKADMEATMAAVLEEVGNDFPFTTKPAQPASTLNLFQRNALRFATSQAQAEHAENLARWRKEAEVLRLSIAQRDDFVLAAPLERLMADRSTIQMLYDESSSLWEVVTSSEMTEEQRSCPSYLTLKAMISTLEDDALTLLGNLTNQVASLQEARRAAAAAAAAQPARPKSRRPGRTRGGGWS